MIKSVRANPLTIVEGEASVGVFVDVDTAALYALCVKEGIDPETFYVPHVVINPDGSYGTDNARLKDAIEHGLEVSSYYKLSFGGVLYGII